MLRWFRQRPLLGLFTLLLAVAGPGLLLSLPSRTVAVEAVVPGATTDGGWPVVPGAFHVHTRRSDGTGSVEEVAAAAAQAGLRFVVLTDHGDGMRESDPPAYHSGVLCLDAVEISATGGHYVALGMEPAPYPLAGESRDVVADVRRLGGFGIAAHPGSRKTELSWSDWSLGFDGIEWVNGDSAWRDESLLRLVAGLGHYLFRAPETVAALFDRPDGVLGEWDRVTADRRVLAVAGSDAHARIGLGGGADRSGQVTFLEVPSYEAVFRTLSIRVGLAQPMVGDAAVDAQRLIEALRAGRVFSVVDAVAAPAAFEYDVALSEGETARMGDTLDPGVPVTFRVRAAVPPGGRIVLLRNGRLVEAVEGAELAHETETQAGAFRVEVHVPGAPGAPPIPWIVSNPIYVFAPSPDLSDPVSAPAVEVVTSLFEDGDGAEWSLEHSEGSRAALDSTPTEDGRELAFRLALGGADEAYAAVRRGLDLADADRLTFRGRADRPLRVSFQLRAPGAGEAEDLRWQRSVYLDSEMRDVTIPLADMSPAEQIGDPHPDLERVDALLVVADTVNTRTGTAAIVWLDDVRLERSAAERAGGS